MTTAIRKAIYSDLLKCPWCHGRIKMSEKPEEHDGRNWHPECYTAHEITEAKNIACEG